MSISLSISIYSNYLTQGAQLFPSMAELVFQVIPLTLDWDLA